MASVWAAIVGSLAAREHAQEVAAAPAMSNQTARGEVNREWIVRNTRGKAFAANGDGARAIEEFNLAIIANPRLAVLYANRGGAKLQQGDRAGAIMDCARAIAMDARCVEGTINRAEAKRESGDWRGAVEDYSRVLEILSPSDMLWPIVKARLERSLEKLKAVAQ